MNSFGSPFTEFTSRIWNLIFRREFATAKARNKYSPIPRVPFRITAFLSRCTRAYTSARDLSVRLRWNFNANFLEKVTAYLFPRGDDWFSHCRPHVFIMCSESVKIRKRNEIKLLICRIDSRKADTCCKNIDKNRVLQIALRSLFEIYFIHSLRRLFDIMNITIN